MQDTVNLQKQIDELKQQIQLLLEWKYQKERQQVSFPLDKTSKDLIIFAVNNP